MGNKKNIFCKKKNTKKTNKTWWFFNNPFILDIPVEKLFVTMNKAESF